MTKKLKASLALLALALAWAGLSSRFGQLLTVEALRSNAESLQGEFRSNPLGFTAAYVGIYVAALICCIPGSATVFTIASGVIFGMPLGVPVTLFSASIGSAAGFLAARYLLRGWVKRRYAGRVRAIDEGIRADGPAYLFTLRLIPVVPFFLINMGMGMTRMPFRVFLGVGLAGMIPGALIYVNAGTQLATIRGTGDILSPRVLGSFLALALLPWAGRALLRWGQARKRSRS